MRSARIRPMAAFHWHESSGKSPMLLLHDASDNYYRPGSGRNSHVRQAYLRSYQFSARESYKQKIKRSVKELGEVAMAAVVEIRQEKIKRSVKELGEVVMAAVVEIRQEISSKLTGLKAFRLRFTASPLALAQHFLKRHVKGCRRKR